MTSCASGPGRGAPAIPFDVAGDEVLAFGDLIASAIVESALAARIAVVEGAARSGGLRAVDGFARAELADRYERIEFPIIEATSDLPAFAGAFHDPEFARRTFESLAARDAMTMDEYVRLARDARSRAFTMSGETNADLVRSVQDALAETVRTGGTRREFVDAVDGAFETFGVAGPEPWRTELIFTQNVRQAQSDGQWDQMRSPGVAEAFPFIRYVARLANTRPNHAWMHNRVYRADDPVWNEWRPLNGFNCHCELEPISRSEAEEQGIVADVERPEAFGIHPDPGFGL